MDAKKKKQETADIIAILQFIIKIIEPAFLSINFSMDYRAFTERLYILRLKFNFFTFTKPPPPSNKLPIIPSPPFLNTVI